MLLVFDPGALTVTIPTRNIFAGSTARAPSSGARAPRIIMTANAATLGIRDLTCPPRSFNDLIGAAEDRGRDLDADLSRHLEVEDQLELGGLPGWCIAGPRSLQHFVDQRRLHGSALA